MKKTHLERAEITKRQGRVLSFVKRFLEEQGFPPTQAEIAEGLGFRSANAAKEHLRLMVSPIGQSRPGLIESK